MPFRVLTSPKRIPSLGGEHGNATKRGFARRALTGMWRQMNPRPHPSFHFHGPIVNLDGRKKTKHPWRLRNACRWSNFDEPATDSVPGWRRWQCHQKRFRAKGFHWDVALDESLSVFMGRSPFSIHGTCGPWGSNRFYTRVRGGLPLCLSFERKGKEKLSKAPLPLS